MAVLESLSSNPEAVNDEDIKKVSQERRTAITSVRRTLRENSFKERVLTVYGYHCAVCGLQMDLVEASHIIPVSAPGSTDQTSNGMALCVLHHKAYDKAIITVDNQYHVIMSRSARDRFREIGRDEGMEDFVNRLRSLIILPPSIGDRPNRKYLEKGMKIRNWAG